MKPQQPNSDAKTDRKARLAEELRANLQRRKAQARLRRTREAEAADASGEAETDEDGPTG